MIDPSQNDIGRSVIYLAGTDRSEEGTITSLGTDYVFVLYRGDRHAKATRRRDLTWVRQEDQKDAP